MRIKADLAGQGAKIETITTAGVENCIVRWMAPRSAQSLAAAARLSRDRAIAVELRRQPPCRPAALIVFPAVGAG